MRAGDKVTRTPVTIEFYEPGKRVAVHRPMSGRVVYVRPKGRYHCVEFELMGGKLRECFKGVD